MNERVVLTVIARKIAFAVNSGPSRPEPEAVAQSMLVDIGNTLANWLSVDDLIRHDVSVVWARIDASKLPDIIMTAKESAKDSRMAVALSGPLAALASCRLLGIDQQSDAASRESLKPFVEQNMLDLGHQLGGTSSLACFSDAETSWTFEPANNLADQFGETEVLRIEIDCSEDGQDDHRAVFLLTPNLLNAAGPEGDKVNDLDVANDRRLSPRLGPCQIDVRAVADRVRMSVADCSRLEIGHVVALPGLRFDQLELTIEMGEGQVPFVDAALGADKGQKAVRLNRGLDPSFRIPPDDMAAVPQSTLVPN